MKYELGTKIYKLDSKGKVREWEINVIDRGDSSDIITLAGLQDGKKVENVVTIREGKNIGKANATTPYTQAVSEAMATAELKLRGEYRFSLDDVAHQTLRSGIQAPMLAQKYHPTGAQKGSKTLEKMKIAGEKVHVQPKYDGTRCMVRINEETITLYTRKGDVMFPIPHIEAQLRDSYNRFVKSGEIILDGELYTNEFSFNTLNGLLRKEHKTPEQMQMLAKVKYHIYDTYSDEGYAERYQIIKNFLSISVPVVPSYEIVATDENIKAKLEEFLSHGHEGLMIRTLTTSYENKRSWQLVKVKIFEDSEFVITDLLPDVMGRLGKVECKMDVPAYDRDGKLIEFVYPGITNLSHEEGREMLANKDKYIGKKATVEYFGRSEYNTPRFPKFKGVRDDV